MKVAMNDEPKLDIEAIRASYRPKRITTLFVGESAPKSGKCFYCGNTALGRYMRNVMEKAGLKIDGNFLECSKVMGWYDGGGHVRCLCRIARTRNARGGLTHQCNIVVEVSASCHKMPCLPKRLLKFSGTMNPVKEDEKLWDAQEPAMKEWLIQAGLAGMQYLELFPQFAKQFIVKTAFVSGMAKLDEALPFQAQLMPASLNLCGKETIGEIKEHMCVRACLGAARQRLLFDFKKDHDLIRLDDDVSLAVFPVDDIGSG
jgi:hypothetical protein